MNEQNDAVLKIPRAASAIFFYGLILMLFAPIRTPLYIYDEGFAVFNATRVLRGELPYKDFWAIYPPGQLYILAGVFKTFGVSLLSARVYDTLVRFGVVLAFYFSTRKLTSVKFAYLAAFVATLVMVSVGFYAYAVYPALAWGLFALWGVLKYNETEQPRWLLLAGVLAGVASFFRWDIGSYAILGLSAAVFLRQMIYQRQGGQSWLSWMVSGVKTTAWLLAPAAAVILLLYGLVSINSGLSYVWEQVFLFPATRLREVRWLAYPPLAPRNLPKISDFWNFYSQPMDWLRFYLPLAVYGLALLYIGAKVVLQRIPLKGPHFGVAAAAGFGLLAFAQALSRYDYIHALPSGLLAFLVVAALVDEVRRAFAPRFLSGALWVLLPGILAVYFTAPLDSFFRTLDHFPPWNCYSRLERASCAFLGENQQQAVEYIWANTQADEPIYVGNQRHDVVFVSDVGFYFLAGRPSATRYSELHPGVADTRPVQQEIIHELESRRVAYLVLVDIPSSNEPNASSRSRGVYDLDAYIRSHYSQTARYGEYTVWKRISK